MRAGTGTETVGELGAQPVGSENATHLLTNGLDVDSCLEANADTIRRRGVAFQLRYLDTGDPQKIFTQ